MQIRRTGLDFKNIFLTTQNLMKIEQAFRNIGFIHLGKYSKPEMETQTGEVRKLLSITFKTFYYYEIYDTIMKTFY